MTFTNRIPPQLSTSSTSSAGNFFGVVKCVLKNNLFVGNQPFLCIQNFSTCPHTTQLQYLQGKPWDTSEKVHKKKGRSLPFEISSHYRLCTKMQNCMEPTVACDLVWAVLALKLIGIQEFEEKNPIWRIISPVLGIQQFASLCLWIQQKTTGCLLYHHDACHVCNQSNWLQQRDSTNLPLPVLVKAFSWYLDP